jgi:hypothetical protein
VERDYDGAEAQQEETFEENADATPRSESLIEVNPRFGSTQVREADHKEGDRGKDLSRMLHR